MIGEEKTVAIQQFAMNMVGRLAAVFPEVFLYWCFLLEDAGDHYYKACADGSNIHPLFKKVSKIHIVEEGRHISFSKLWIAKNLPNAPWYRRLALEISAPLIAKSMDTVVRNIDRDITAQNDVPAEVKKEINQHPLTAKKCRIALHNSISFSKKVGIVNRRNQFLWRSLKL